MFASFMTDELELDIKDCLETIKGWGFRYVDLRNRLFGASLEDLDTDQLRKLKAFLDRYEMKAGMLHSSIGKVNNPEDPGVFAQQMCKAENIIRASEILGVESMRLFPLRPDAFTKFGSLDSRSAWWDRIISLNRPVFELLGSAGLTIAIENAAFHINDAIHIAQEFSAFHAGIAWDIMGGWILRNQSEPVDDYFARLAPLIRNIHVKMFALPGYEHNFAMGDEGITAGSIPWDKLLPAVKRAGGGGPLSVETQKVMILRDPPSMTEANRMLSEFVLHLADEQ